MSISAYSQKNLALSPAAADLGLGDQLNQELQNQLAQRRKKLLSGGTNLNAQTLTGSASSDLFQLANSGLGV